MAEGAGQGGEIRLVGTEWREENEGREGGGNEGG